MTYDPNRDPGQRDLMGRDRGMWGWIIAIAAVIVLGIIVWAAVDTGPDMAEKSPPATQKSSPPSTVGSGPADKSGGSAPKSGSQPGGATAPGGAKP